MSENETQPGRGPGGGLALVFAVCALAASWNPIAAPFGLLVGVAAAALGFRALRSAGSRRRVPAAALSVGLLAAVASVVVLLVTAGSVGVDLPGEPIVKGRTAAELEQVLSQAADRTRPQRERAGRELDRLSGANAGGERPERAAPSRDGGGAVPEPPRNNPP
jgi:hypothetical protein